MFHLPKIRTPDDELIAPRFESLETRLLDVLNGLDFPPLREDRLSIKIRIFATSATKVKQLNNKLKAFII